jgi:DNA-binding transcriptional LysR family regulator
MAHSRPDLDTRATATLLRRLTMAEMRALAAVKAAGTLSAAANLLGVSQPTLSQHIRDSESKLGAQLFERHRRGIHPTPAGAVMLRLAAALQVDFAQAAEELSIAVRADLRPIRIGSMAIASAGILALALGRFASESVNRAPVVVLEGPREQLLEHLSHGRVDLFVGRLPPEGESAGLQRELLFLDTLEVVCSPRHELASRRRVDFDSLQRYRWIVPGEDTTFYQQVAQSLRNAGAAVPLGMVQAYSMHLIPAVVACSSLLGFLPASLYAGGVVGSSLRRVRAAIGWTPAPIGLLMHPAAASEERLQPLLRTLRGVAASAQSASRTH